MPAMHMRCLEAASNRADEGLREGGLRKLKHTTLMVKGIKGTLGSIELPAVGSHWS